MEGLVDIANGFAGIGAGLWLVGAGQPAAFEGSCARRRRKGWRVPDRGALDLVELDAPARCGSALRPFLTLIPCAAPISAVSEKILVAPADARSGAEVLRPIPFSAKGSICITRFAGPAAEEDRSTVGPLDRWTVGNIPADEQPDGKTPSNGPTSEHSNGQTPQPSNGPTIQRSNDPTIQRSNDQTVQRSNDQTVQRSNGQTVQRSNDQTAQRSNAWLVLATASRTARVPVAEDATLSVRPESIVAWTGPRPSGFCPRLGLGDLLLPRGPKNLLLRFHGPCIVWVEGSGKRAEMPANPFVRRAV